MTVTSAVIATTKYLFGLRDCTADSDVENVSSRNTIVRLLLLSITALLFQVFSNVSCAIYKWGWDSRVYDNTCITYISFMRFFHTQYIIKGPTIVGSRGKCFISVISSDRKMQS